MGDLEGLAQFDEKWGPGAADAAFEPREPSRRARTLLDELGVVGPALPRSGTGLYLEVFAGRYYMRVKCRCGRNEKVRLEKIPTEPDPIYV